jgi:hypothetical protein
MATFAIGFRRRSLGLFAPVPRQAGGYFGLTWLGDVRMISALP